MLARFINHHSRTFTTSAHDHTSRTNPLISRCRNAELARQRAALEEHVAVSEARLAAVEQAFAAYRDQVLLGGTTVVQLR